VLRTACIQALTWDLDGNRNLKVAINISGRQFRHPDFLETTERIIRETGVNPETLEFEFTESVIMEKAERTIDTLMSLRKMGINLSIDDFGTGYCSLSYLKHFPINKIKIDRSFITDVKEGTDDAAIVEAIISLAHSLNLKVMAEGVENAEQMDFLTARNCSEAQGFFLGHPMEASAIFEQPHPWDRMKNHGDDQL
jgi:EAL domain-containing protein (putative c-di-GMP-specific phosphodiesterase class I)